MKKALIDNKKTESLVNDWQLLKYFTISFPISQGILREYGFMYFCFFSFVNMAFFLA